MRRGASRDWRSTVEIATAIGQVEAVRSDAGIGVLHDFMAAQYPQLVRVLPEEVSFTRSFWFIVHEDYARLERIRRVSDAIVEGMRKKLAVDSQATA